MENFVATQYRVNLLHVSGSKIENEKLVIFILISKYENTQAYLFLKYSVDKIIILIFNKFLFKKEAWLIDLFCKIYICLHKERYLKPL